MMEMTSAETQMLPTYQKNPESPPCHCSGETLVTGHQVSIVQICPGLFLAFTYIPFFQLPLLPSFPGLLSPGEKGVRSHHNPGDLQGQSTTAWPPDPVPPTHPTSQSRSALGRASLRLPSNLQLLAAHSRGWDDSGRRLQIPRSAQEFPIMHHSGRRTRRTSGKGRGRQQRQRLRQRGHACLLHPGNPGVGSGRVSLSLAPLLTSKEAEPKDQARLPARPSLIQTEVGRRWFKSGSAGLRPGQCWSAEERAWLMCHPVPTVPPMHRL